MLRMVHTDMEMGPIFCNPTQPKPETFYSYLTQPGATLHVKITKNLNLTLTYDIFRLTRIH